MQYPDVSDPREGLCVLPIDTVDLGATAFAGANVSVPERVGTVQPGIAETSRFGWQRLREVGAVVVAPMVERLQGAEGKVQSLIERAERIIIGTYHRAPLPYRISRSCGLVSDVFRYVTEDDAQRYGSEVKADIYQVQHLHAAASGVSIDEPEWRYNTEAGDAFRHGMNVATIGKKKFLVDLSFSQFLVPGGRNYEQLLRSPVAQKLIHRGYVPLTKKNLQEYIRITSKNGNADYANNVTPAIFETVVALDFDGERPELFPEIGLTEKQLAKVRR